MWKVTYSLNVFARAGRTMWLIALMCNTTAVACCAAATRPVVAPRDWRMSDFFPARSDPRTARLGGSLWFSNRKKSAMLTSGRDCSGRIMNSCVTRIMLCRWTPTSFLHFSAVPVDWRKSTCCFAWWYQILEQINLPTFLGRMRREVFHQLHVFQKVMTQQAFPWHVEFRVLPAPDLLQRKGCQAALLPSGKMIYIHVYPFGTLLASWAPPRDDLWRWRWVVDCIELLYHPRTVRPG